MAENVKKMRQRHEREIAQLQKNCPHKKTGVMPYMWAPGHRGPDVEVCSHCGKIVSEHEWLLD